MALTDSLVSYWKLDESSGNASDSVGSNTLTNNNTVTYSSGKINNGANFVSASSQYLSVTDNASLSIIGNMTIAGWVYIATQPSDVYYVIASKYLGTGNQRSFEFRYGDVSGTKKFEFRNSPDGTGASTTIGTLNYASLATTTWTHIAMTYVASTGVVTIYANGTSIGTITSMATSIFDSTALFGLGGNNNGDGDYLNGSLDETGIWNRALRADEVTALYDSGTGNQYPFNVTPSATNLVSYWKLDESSGNASDSVGSNTLTNNNTVAFVTGKINNGADFENGNSETFSIANASQTGLNFTGSRSFSFWINVESMPTSGEDWGILGKRTSSVGGYSIYYGYGVNGGTSNPSLYMQIYEGSDYSYYVNTTLSLGVWYHVAVVYDNPNKTTYFYVNGVLVGSMTLANDTPLNDTNPFYVGIARNGETRYFDGILDEIGAWSRIITGKEIYGLYNGGAGLQYPFTSSAANTGNFLMFM